MKLIWEKQENVNIFAFVKNQSHSQKSFHKGKTNPSGFISKTTEPSSKKQYKLETFPENKRVENTFPFNY